MTTYNVIRVVSSIPIISLFFYESISQVFIHIIFKVYGFHTFVIELADLEWGVRARVPPFFAKI